MRCVPTRLGRRSLVATAARCFPSPACCGSSGAYHTVAVGNEGATSIRTIKELFSGGTAGQEVVVRGWVRSCRAQKTVSFAEVGDGSTLHGLQVVVPDGIDCGTNPSRSSGDALGVADRRVAVGASVEVTGELVDCRAAAGKAPLPHQRLELRATAVRVVGDCDAATYPLQKKAGGCVRVSCLLCARTAYWHPLCMLSQGHSTEFLRDIVHLRPRTNLMGAVARVRHSLAEGLRKALADEAFVEVNTPLITSNDCEGAGELFRLSAPGEQIGCDVKDSFFGSPAFLTVGCRRALCLRDVGKLTRCLAVVGDRCQASCTQRALLRRCPGFTPLVRHSEQRYG